MTQSYLQRTRNSYSFFSGTKKLNSGVRKDFSILNATLHVVLCITSMYIWICEKSLAYSRSVVDNIHILKALGIEAMKNVH